jgi:hypothetical protein
MVLLDKGEAAKGVEMAVLVGLEIGLTTPIGFTPWRFRRGQYREGVGCLFANLVRSRGRQMPNGSIRHPRQRRRTL